MSHTLRKVGMRVIQHKEKGAVLITVSMCLFLLLGIVALAIDGGLAYNERRSTQGAADHAALAAAWAACNAKGEAAAVQAGREAAAKNGYDDSDPDIEVNVRRLGGSQAKYEAVIRSTNETEFGAVIGQDDMSVASRAVADCLRKVWGGGYALFALGDQPCTNMELDFTGGGITVDGGVHSNGDLRLNGNNGNPSTINGLVTHVGTQTSNGVNITGGGPDQSDPVADPFELDFADFTPAANAGNPNFYQFGVLDNGALAPHENASGELVDSGIYYASSEIKNLDVKPAPGVRATFVSPGPIKLNPSSEVHYYHPSGVAVFSNHQLPPTCDNKAIQWTGAAEFTGLIYAPNGEIKFSMSEGATAMGALVGYNLDISGSKYSIKWTDVTGGGPEFQLEFEE